MQRNAAARPLLQTSSVREFFDRFAVPMFQPLEARSGRAPCDVILRPCCGDEFPRRSEGRRGATTSSVDDLPTGTEVLAAEVCSALSRAASAFRGACLDVNTARMYNHLLMGSRVINVRLGPEDERVARQLRARGISISDVVRRALHAEARKAAESPADTDSVLNEIIERYPTPTRVRRSQRPNTLDRHAVRKHIEQRLRGKR